MTIIQKRLRNYVAIKKICKSCCKIWILVKLHYVTILFLSLRMTGGYGTPPLPQFPQGWPHPYMMSPYYAAQMNQWYQMMYLNNHNPNG